MCCSCNVFNYAWGRRQKVQLPPQRKQKRATTFWGSWRRGKRNVPLKPTLRSSLAVAVSLHASPHALVSAAVLTGKLLYPLFSVVYICILAGYLHYKSTNNVIQRVHLVILDFTMSSVMLLDTVLLKYLLVPSLSCLLLYFCLLIGIY